MYLYSWQVVGQLSMIVEGFFTKMGIPFEKRQKFFLVRGAFPFYLISSLFLLTYFMWLSPEGYYEQWKLLFFGTMIVKVCLVLIFICVNIVCLCTHTRMGST